MLLVILVNTNNMFLWRNKKYYLRIITKYSSLTSTPQNTLFLQGIILIMDEETRCWLTPAVGDSLNIPTDVLMSSTLSEVVFVPPGLRGLISTFNFLPASLSVKRWNSNIHVSPQETVCHRHLLELLLSSNWLTHLALWITCKCINA